ncbi:hypothetical protein HDR58_01260 [bacterium]|nr:hypothetical protein [bacterium]
MLNKVLSYFTPNRHNTAKNLVNISYKADTEFLPEEFRILERAKGVIENFAKKNNISVDMFFKESKADNITSQMVDVKVKHRTTGSEAERSIIYKNDNKPMKFITKKNNVRWVKAEDREYIQEVPSPAMNITIHDTIAQKISKLKLELPNIRIRVREYNNYSIPKIVGEGEYEDSFLRHVYRVIEQLEQLTKKAQK